MHTAIIKKGGWAMAMMSIRGLDENILRELKACAKREGISLNSLALRLLNEGYFSKKNGGRRVSRSRRPGREMEPGGRGRIWTEHVDLFRNRPGSLEIALAHGSCRYQRLWDLQKERPDPPQSLQACSPHHRAFHRPWRTLGRLSFGQAGAPEP